MMQKSIRSYESVVGTVCQHIGDRELVQSLAEAADGLHIWEDPDKWDHLSPAGVEEYSLEKTLWANAMLNELELARAAKVYQNEVQSRQTLCSLSREYKRLKTIEEAVPSVVFSSIILKMLHIGSEYAEHEQKSLRSVAH